MTRHTRLLQMFTAGLLVAFTALSSGCPKKGPAEKAGEKIDETVQKAKDKLDPPGPAEKAGRKIDKALGDD